MAPRPPSPQRQRQPAPSARARRLARISGAEHPLAPSKTYRHNAAVTDAFLSSKRDRRLIKHSSFLARVAASSSSSSRVTKSHHKRAVRRPGNKLATSLGSLADALPSLDDNDDDDEHDGDGDNAAGGKAWQKVRHRSIRSKPGALKRKEMVVKGEMARFGASMARLSGAVPPIEAAAPKSLAPQGGAVQPQQTTPPAQGQWAALRGYISATMEQAPAFVGKK